MLHDPDAFRQPAVTGWWYPTLVHQTQREGSALDTVDCVKHYWTLGMTALFRLRDLPGVSQPPGCSSDKANYQQLFS